MKRFNLFWAALFFFAGIMAVLVFYRVIAPRSEDTGVSQMGSNAPYYAEIKEIIKPLRYSGFSSLMMPEVKITINFIARTWRLHNIHHFDDEGKVVLVEGRYGLCGDLAAYLYDKIKPLLGNEYDIDFVRVAESGYFLDPRASHIALLITRQSLFGQAVYLLDPSFRRYGLESDFDEYLFFDKMRELPFVENKNRDEVFNIGAITPILIRKEYIVGLIVDEQNARFDKDNFIVAITATRRFKYTGRALLTIRRIDGRTEVMENTHLAGIILGRDIYAKLRERIMQLYSELP
ncbi:MAG: hypothetical protein WC532_08560 [Candidatus Omnitrophota bacterium]